MPNTNQIAHLMQGQPNDPKQSNHNSREPKMTGETPEDVTITNDNTARTQITNHIIAPHCTTNLTPSHIYD